MQRDYILRMIEQAAAVLRAVLARLARAGADAQSVRADLARAANLGGFDLDLLRVVDARSAVSMLSPGGEPEPGRTWLAAEVLFLDGLAARRDGDSDRAAASFVKARLLYGMIAPNAVLPSGFPEAAERLREIEEHLTETSTGGVTWTDDI